MEILLLIMNEIPMMIIHGMKQLNQIYIQH